MKIVLNSLLILPFAAVAAGTNELQLVPPYPELPPPFWEQHQSAIILGASILVILGGGAIWRLLRPKPVRSLPPEHIARAALEKLSHQAEDGKGLSEVSQTLRRYLGAVFDFSAGEMTTAEFIPALARHGKMDPKLGAAIADFLRECDVRKFAPAKAPVPLNAAGRALALVQQVERRLAESGAAQPISK